MKTIDPNTKLEEILALPLGTVLRDNKGITHIFIGTHRNTESLEFHFAPRIGEYANGIVSHYSLWRGASARFPELARYLRPAAVVPNLIDELNRIADSLEYAGVRLIEGRKGTPEQHGHDVNCNVDELRAIVERLEGHENENL